MLPDRIHWLRFRRCIDACRGPDIRRGLFCGRRRCDTFAQTAWTREKAPWARASGRERGIRKHDDTFNRVAFLSPGTAAGLIAPNGSGKTTLLEALSGQFPTRIHSGSLAADGISQRQSAEFAELVYLSSSGGTDLYPTLSASSTLLSLGRRGNRPPTSTRSATPSESPHISTSRPVNSRRE